jgi:hypothetical protein
VGAKGCSTESPFTRARRFSSKPSFTTFEEVSEPFPGQGGTDALSLGGDRRKRNSKSAGALVSERLRSTPPALETDATIDRPRPPLSPCVDSRAAARSAFPRALSAPADAC